MPGTGKTTLANKIADDLRVPLVTKDDLKEFLYDKLQTQTREESKLLGIVAFEALYVLAQQYAHAGLDLIIEAPFYAQFARTKLDSLKEIKNVEVIELYCQLPEHVRKERIEKRIENGERHEQHIGGDLTDDTEEMLMEKFAPLEIGTLIRVDTSISDDDSYNDILSKLRDVN